MTATRVPVGIDDLNVHAGALAVDSVALAMARGLNEENAKRLNLRRRSLAPNFEDPVTLAVNAALPLIDAADPADYGLLIVATESGVDYAKPLSTYVHRYLGLPSRCRNFELKHACYGGTAAVRTAVDWVRANPGGRALVIATDMARRLFDDPGEPAEGAGAVAMSIVENPRVLALDDEYGVATREIYDVMRPDPVREVIHSGLSLGAYLDLFELAFADYFDTVGEKAFDEFAYLAYHTPITALVRQAHGLLADAYAPDTDAAGSFDELVGPSLRYPQELGNLYSGCLWAAVASLVDNAPVVVADMRIGLYSYGSGSCAEFFSGRIGPRARETVARHDIAGRIAGRHPVAVADYEWIVLDTERGLINGQFTPDLELCGEVYDAMYAGQGLLTLDNVKDHYRTYRWS